MSKTLAEKVYARVMVALADPIREEILRLLLGKSDGISFTKIKNKLKIQNDASLSNHLNALQRSCLVERTSNLGDLKTSGDPYYSITPIGRAIIPSIPDAIRTAISEALASKSIPEYYPGENGPIGSFSL